MPAEKIKVSIIIPVYNGAEFLRRSFDCAVYQTLPEVEVIAVNDCSPNPRDAEIMREYEELYPKKFRCIFHAKNMRQGGARNTGIKAARGEYFLCVDQDDFFELEMCERMVECATKDDAELVVCEFYLLNLGCARLICPNPQIEAVSAENRYKHMLYNVAWVLLVKTELARRNALFFPVGTTCDDIISYFWYMSAKKISRVDKGLYYWIQSELSTSRSYGKHYFTLVTAIKKLLEYPYYINLNYNQKTGINRAFCNFLIHTFMNVYSEMVEGKRLWYEYSELIYKLGGNYLPIMKIVERNIDSDLFDIEKIFFIHSLIVQTADIMSKKITIWGAGNRCKHVIDYLRSDNIQFNITDKNIALHGTEISGVVVRSWEDLREQTNIVIISALNIYDSVLAEINDPSIRVFDFKELVDNAKEWI